MRLLFGAQASELTHFPFLFFRLVPSRVCARLFATTFLLRSSVRSVRPLVISPQLFNSDFGYSAVVWSPVVRYGASTPSSIALLLPGRASLFNFSTLHAQPYAPFFPVSTPRDCMKQNEET